MAAAKEVAETSVVLAEGTVQAFDPSAWQELTLACLGSKLTATINGQVVAALTDSTYDSGSAALGSGFHHAAFDDFKIKALAPLPQELVPGHTLAAFTTFTDVKLEVARSGWFGFAFTVMNSTSALTVSHLARFATSKSIRTHRMRLVMAPPPGSNPSGSKAGVANAIVANATVDMGAATKMLDALGFVYTPLSPAVALHSKQQYYLVAEETAGADPFYSLASAQPCIGHAGGGDTLPRKYTALHTALCTDYTALCTDYTLHYALTIRCLYTAGGTLPRMDVPTAAIRIDGGVSTTDPETGGGWQHYPDWEPRSFGPLTFLFHEE
jgi:hypothetical protein